MAGAGAAYKSLLGEFGGITALAHSEMFVLTDSTAEPRHEV